MSVRASVFGLAAAVATAAAIATVKPSFAFDQNGAVKELGLNSDKGETLAPLWLVTAAVGLSAYAIALMD